MAKAEPVSCETTRFVHDHCLCLYAQRAARALARRFDDALRPLGLTNGQFSLMMALNRPEPPMLGFVAVLLGMDRTTLTAALKPLVRRGLVAMQPGVDDRRSRLLTLTVEGKVLLARAFPIWKNTHAELDEQLAAHDPGPLRDALRAIAR